MSEKKVLCCSLEVPDRLEFSKILLSKRVKGEFIRIKDKAIEISHISRDKNLITGMFVTTLVGNIPPAHTPGDENDYSAVDLGYGRGLAYPNAFLYDSIKKILLWEVNRLGVTENYICDFFRELVSKMDTGNAGDFYINLHPVLSADAYARVENMMRIDEVEFQIVAPETYMRGIHENKSVMYVAKTAELFGASKAISIKMSADEHKSLNKKGILNMAKFISSIGLSPAGRKRNKLVIRGIKDEEGRSVEEAVNFMVDRMCGYFSIPDLRRAHSLQVRERKEGIRSVYDDLKTDIYTLIG